MFEKELADKLQKIFRLKKVTYDEPGDSREQETLFIEVERSRNSIKDGKELAMVTGKCKVFAQAEKLPFGFFSKAIKTASPALTKDLHFYEIEANSKQFVNIAEKGFSFTYFFRGQYDPDLGTITSVTTTIEEQ